MIFYFTKFVYQTIWSDKENYISKFSLKWRVKRYKIWLCLCINLEKIIIARLCTPFFTPKFFLFFTPIFFYNKIFFFYTNIFSFFLHQFFLYQNFFFFFYTKIFLFLHQNFYFFFTNLLHQKFCFLHHFFQFLL